MRLAKAIHDAASEHASAVRGSHQLGEVLNASPLRVALIDSDITLDEDGIDLGAWAQAYDGGAGIAEGDTLVLHRMSGYWVVTDVLGDAGPTEAIQNLIDASVGAARYVANVGNGSATSFTVTHSLGTRDVMVQVYRNSSPWETVACDVERTSTAAVTVKFAAAPSTNQYRVMVRA